MDCLVCGVPKGATYTDGVVVAQIASDFSDNHGNGIGGEFDSYVRVKIVNGLNETDTANLKQIIHIFVISGKALDDA